MGSETYQGMSTILIIASRIVRRIAPNIAAPYPIFMKSIVGRTLKITLSTSSPSSERVGTEDCGRAILVSSGSWTGAPQVLQNRLSESRNDPHLSQCTAYRSNLIQAAKRRAHDI